MTVYPVLDPVSYGEHCEAACEIFAFVLQERLTVLRRHSAIPIKGLSAFDADKTMRLLDKMWRARTKQSKFERAEQHRVVDLPVKSFNDKHGHRIGFVGNAVSRKEANRKPSAVLESMIGIDTALGHAHRLLNIHEKKWEWGTLQYVDSQVTVINLVKLQRRGLLGDEDIAFLKAFGQATGTLSEQEVVAIGRHENTGLTRRAVLWELWRCQQWAEDTLEGLKNSQLYRSRTLLKQTARQSWQCWSFAREAVLKARNEQGDYETGYLTMQAALEERVAKRGPQDYGAVLDTFRDAQHPAQAIWQTPGVQVLQFIARFFQVFACYLTGTIRNAGAFQGTPDHPKINAEEADNAYRSLECFCGFEGPECPRSFPANDEQRIIQSRRTSIAATPPSDVWDNSVTLAEFSQGATQVLDDICARHLAPELEAVDSLEA